MKGTALINEKEESLQTSIVGGNVFLQEDDA
jgi:hypothetical protein